MSNHSFNSNGRGAEKKDEEDDDQLMPTIGKTIGAVAGAAFAAWGISKLFNTPSESSSSRSNEAMTMNAARPRESTESVKNYHPPPNGSQWRPPKQGWLKLNTDASIQPFTGTASIGGVVRDCEGDYIDGFAGRIEFCNNPEIAELKAIKAGLKWAWDRGFRKIEVETDSKEAKEMILERNVKRNDPNAQLIQDCRDLLNRNWEGVRQLRPEHVEEHCNRVADRIAVLGHRLQIGEIRSYKSPPPEILHCLSNDKSW